MVRESIEQFLKTAAEPVLIEPGEDPLPIRADRFVLGTRAGCACTLECWDDTRNLVRRIRAVGKVRRGFVELEVERFGGRTGSLLMIDLAQASNAPTPGTAAGSSIASNSACRFAASTAAGSWWS